MSSFKKYAAEFIGTAVLVLFGCGAAVTANSLVGSTGVAVPLAVSTLIIAVAFGLVIVGMAYSVGNVSGCHINPAVSLSMLINKKMTVKDFIGYVIAQYLGGIAGAAILLGICGQNGDRAGLGHEQLFRKRSRNFHVGRDSGRDSSHLRFRIRYLRRNEQKGIRLRGRSRHRSYADAHPHFRNPAHGNVRQPGKIFRSRAHTRVHRKHNAVS